MLRAVRAHARVAPRNSTFFQIFGIPTIFLSIISLETTPLKTSPSALSQCSVPSLPRRICTATGPGPTSESQSVRHPDPLGPSCLGLLHNVNMPCSLINHVQRTSLLRLQHCCDCSLLPLFHQGHYPRVICHK